MAAVVVARHVVVVVIFIVVVAVVAVLSVIGQLLQGFDPMIIDNSLFSKRGL